ncbi:27454_t:CDS:2 [Gigaspora margarita]|uniref:27454_t:CDS:1 n=1 Tax=Gigaspora margarita TaxID=4874 RepID=A0ABN7VB46_GIGMA|nr:27454_t:CDS:2 [Gigaspora margarita]
MAIQDERERLLLLYNEFVEDNVVNTEDLNTKQYIEEMKPDGYTWMFNFYQKGLIRLYNIFHKDIYKTKEVVTKGRWVKELVSILAKEYLLSLKDN